MIRDKAICFPTYRFQNFCMLLPSSSEGYYNPSAHHPGFQQQLIYYSGAYIVWEEGAFTCAGRFGASPYSSGRILACWDHSLHHQLIYILVCTCIDFSYFIASQYFSRAHICMHAKFGVFFPIWLRSKSISHLQYTHKQENISLGYYKIHPYPLLNHNMAQSFDLIHPKIAFGAFHK